MAALDALLDAYAHTLFSVLAATEDLTAEQWARPTRCPGWNVHDQVAHIVGLESMAAGDDVPDEAPPAEFVRGPVGKFMQRAVHARRHQSPSELRADLAAVIPRRQLQLRGRSLDEQMPGLLGRPMPLRLLLPLRVYDVWAHEQDIRAALTRPGGLTGPAADVAWSAMQWGLIDAVTEAGATPGQSVRIEVTGARPDAMLAAVAADGSVDTVPVDTVPVDTAPGGGAPAAEPSATVTLDWAHLVARMCGRQGATDTPVRIDGDTDLAAGVLAELAMTP